MNRLHAALAVTLILGSCAEGEDSKAPPKGAMTVEPAVGEQGTAETPTPSTTEVVPSIASVQLVQDCPDPKTELAADVPPASEPMAKVSAMESRAASRRKSKAKGDSDHGFTQPCTQSTVQLAFAGKGSKGGAVKLLELRLLSAEGKALGTLESRLPSLWGDGQYKPWDGVLPADTDHKASYKLALPDWGAVEATLGGTSFGPMYVLEVDVEIAGKSTTLRSPEFERGRPEIIKT